MKRKKAIEFPCVFLESIQAKFTGPANKPFIQAAVPALDDPRNGFEHTLALGNGQSMERAPAIHIARPSGRWFALHGGYPRWLSTKAYASHAG